MAIRAPDGANNDLKTEMLCKCDHALANCSFELESVDIIST